MPRVFLVVGPSVCFVWHAHKVPGHVVEAARRLAVVTMTLECFGPTEVTVVAAGAEPQRFWQTLQETHSSAVSMAPGLQAFCHEKGRPNSITMSHTGHSDSTDLQSKWGDSSMSSGSLFNKSSRRLSTSHDQAVSMSFGFEADMGQDGLSVSSGKGVHSDEDMVFG